MRSIIIAEAGVNHNGKLELAKEMVEKAKTAGADYIKFQTFCSESLVTKNAKKAAYQVKSTGCEESQLDMLKKLELTQDDFYILKEYCKKYEIGFLSTPFDLESITFLEKLDMDYWKIPSGEVNDYPYLACIAKTNQPILLSTGMCTQNEIQSAIQILAKDKKQIILLHCNTEYPTPFHDVNLAAIIKMKEYYQLPTGYSDHTIGIEIPIAAAALGAAVIEKHFTLDNHMEGPDHAVSLDPIQLTEMIQKIRNVEKSIGDGVKAPTDSEKDNRKIVRKSIVAKKMIQQGEHLSEKNLTTKRPGTGLSPMMWNEIIGTCAKRDFKKDEMIEL